MLPPPKPSTASDRSFALPKGCTEVRHLMGATRLADFLTFVRERADLSALYGEDSDPMMEMAESWRAAARVYDALETAEPYPQDAPTIFPAPAEMLEYCDQLVALPHIRREFDRVPVAIGMVPLAHLICAQQRIQMPQIATEAAVPQRPADAELFASCLPLTAPPHAFHVIQQVMDEKQGSVTFASDNHDIRVLSTQVVNGKAAEGNWPGYSQGVLAVPVGFSGNVVNVIRFQDRLVLNNGYHRVCDLQRRGLTHVPAIIHVCRHWEDVGLAGSSEVFQNGSVYFERKRPPLIKDFADSRLAISLAVPASRKFVRVKYEIEVGYLNT